MSYTKIVATIGPRTNNAAALRALAAAGLNVARLNGSHSDLDWHAATIELIRDTLPQVPILLDIPGRKIRTTQVTEEPSFTAGDKIVFTTEEGHDGSKKVGLNNPTLHQQLEPGAVILADDGTLRFTVERVEGQDIHCTAEAAGSIRSRMGINVPFIVQGGDLITDKDREMVAFAKNRGVDFIGISFVQSAKHVEAVRALTGGSSPRIVSKIESQAGLDNLDAILEATDAAMIDRGDLSVETNLENLAISQKRILKASHNHGTPVIVATEMLHSMIDPPFPTKAEVTDITHAVLDGGSATMLSGETAIGDFPIESVKTMRGILTSADAHVQELFDAEATLRQSGIQNAMQEAVALLCRSLPITKIVAVTMTGYAARSIAARRPQQPIIAVSNDAMAARSFNLLPGVEGFCADLQFSRNSTDHFAGCLEAVWRAGKLTDEDLILVTGVGYPKPGNVMNLMQTHYVKDLVVALGWK